MNKQHKNSKISKRRIAVLSLLTVLILIGSYFAFWEFRYYKQTADQANIVQIRELILLAVKGVKKDAPIDARTGDVYFPESKLYLPNPNMLLKITYLQDIGNISDSQSELSVSTYPVFGTTNMYSANNMRSLFEVVPKLQACSRGIKIVSDKLPASDSENEFKYSVTMQSGKTLYIYREKACPELDILTDVLKNLKSY